MPNLASTMMTADPQNKQPTYSFHSASANWRPARRDRSAASVPDRCERPRWPRGRDRSADLGRSGAARRSAILVRKIVDLPKLIVPLQIDLAKGVGRYRFGIAINPTPTCCGASGWSSDRS